MLEEILKYVTKFGFKVVDGYECYLSFSSEKHTGKQCEKLKRELKREFGKQNISVDVFVYTKKVIIEIKVKAIHDENELRKIK